MHKKLQIFKPGKHVAMSGQGIEFSEADLTASVAAYDPAKHEAPLVIGHPRLDGPAYGWVKGLDFADGVMQAEPDQVDATFAEMVNSGKFKKISASFFTPTAPGNPVPGVYYLRHVGFLGATPPAVKGLKSASFAEGEEGVVEFGDWADRVEAGLFRKLREWIIGKFGQEEADKALPPWDVDTVQNEAVQPEPEPEAPLSPSFAAPSKEDTMKQEELAAQKAELDRQQAEFAERERAFSAKETEQRHNEHVSFAEALICDGKLLPAKKDQAVALLDFCAGLDATHVVEFGEGDGKQSAHAAELLKSYLSAQPKIVEFGEVAPPNDDAATVANFAAAPGYTVSAEGLATHNKAKAYQAANPGTDYLTAVKAVQ